MKCWVAGGTEGVGVAGRVQEMEGGGGILSEGRGSDSTGLTGSAAWGRRLGGCDAESDAGMERSGAGVGKT